MDKGQILESLYVLYTLDLADFQKTYNKFIFEPHF